MGSNTEPLDIRSAIGDQHWHSSGNGLALVSFGNKLRGDDGLAAALGERVIQEYPDLACYFDLEGSGFPLPDCLAGHESAVIVDATKSDLAPGALTILELPPLLRHNKVMPGACHGISWFDELRLAAERNTLPRSLTFFGVEICDSSWGSPLSPELTARLPRLSELLAALLFLKAEEKLCTSLR